jgi:hypothetical protein
VEIFSSLGDFSVRGGNSKLTFYYSDYLPDVNTIIEILSRIEMYLLVINNQGDEFYERLSA